MNPGEHTPLERLAAELADDSGGEGLLVVSPAPATAIDAATVRWDPCGSAPPPQGTFARVLCAEAIQAGSHPANLLVALWEMMPVGGTLFLHSRVLTELAHSAFARFGSTEWLPGRLALRWTVETNGFDFDRWIDAGPSRFGDGDAYLVAIRSERIPALVFATASTAPPEAEGALAPSAEDAPSSSRSMGDIAKLAEHQKGKVELTSGDFDPATLIRFSAHVKDTLEVGELATLTARAEELAPWLQGPFLVGGDLVLGGAWRADGRWDVLDAEVPESLAGKRVLDVGSNAGYDPFRLSLRHPEYLLACEPFAFIEQARFLESIYRTGIEFRQVGWQSLDPDVDGRFDIVHCHGVLYHEIDPMGLLERLFEMTAPGGVCLFGSMMHADPTLADLVRLVPLSYFGDDTWWWVPGPVAMRRMLTAVGFEIEKVFGVSAGPPPGEFPTINGNFRAVRPA